MKVISARKEEAPSNVKKHQHNLSVEFSVTEHHGLTSLFCTDHCLEKLDNSFLSCNPRYNVSKFELVNLLSRHVIVANEDQRENSMSSGYALPIMSSRHAIVLKPRPPLFH